MFLDLLVYSDFVAVTHTFHLKAIPVSRQSVNTMSLDHSERPHIHKTIFPMRRQRQFTLVSYALNDSTNHGSNCTEKSIVISEIL